MITESVRGHEKFWKSNSDGCNTENAINATELFLKKVKMTNFMSDIFCHNTNLKVNFNA